MPTFDMAIEGKIYHVQIPDPGACPLRVIVDGQPFDVVVAGTGATVRPAAATVEPPHAAPEPPPLPRPAPAAPARPAARPGTGGGEEVRAPMPGTILAVNVSVGQAVKATDVVCVLEAMKMKNPIRATQSGVVAEIVVTPGQNVAHGDLLIRLA